MRREKPFNLLQAIRGSQLDAVRPCGQPESMIASNAQSRTLGTIAPTTQKVKMCLVDHCCRDVNAAHGKAPPGELGGALL
jgi:hypothetical protein